jgi:YegS/Rv2252/BmrU family lipid kinase
MKTIVIINQKSGKRRARGLESALRSSLSSVHPEIYRTSFPGHGARIARLAVERNVHMIVAVGGDGTVNEIVNVIAGMDIMLGIIPSGTANDLASLYNLPGDIDKACRIILDRNTREIDLISVNGKYYATAGGVGLPCEAAELANNIKCRGAIGKTLAGILGSQLYIFAVVAALFKRAGGDNYLNIRYGNRAVGINALSVMVDNQPYLGKSIFMSPGALNDDGLFDICLIDNHISRLKILHLLMKIMKGAHIYMPSVQAIKTDRITIRSEKPISFFGDGEILSRDTEFNLKILPRSLKLIVPRGKREIE